MVAGRACRVIVPGEAQGAVLLSHVPLSFWGGIDPTSGVIIDQRHDRRGESVVGRILAIPSEKGSSTGSAVLLELVRTGNAPAAIITCHLAPIVALGAIVARELYGASVPILLVSEQAFTSLVDGEHVQIAGNGFLTDII